MSFTDTGTSLFVVFTGYLMCNRKWEIGKLFKLWAEIVFTGIIVIMICVMLGVHIRIVSLVRTCFPILAVHYWFIFTYFLLYLSIPFINRYLSQIRQKNFKTGLWIVGFIFTVVIVSNPFPDMNQLGFSGKSLLFFIYLYCIGAYCKIHELSIKKGKWYIIGIVSVFVLFCKYFLELELPLRGSLTGTNALFPILLMTSMFIVLKDVKINNTVMVKILKKLSECALLGYILQEHDALREWFWHHIFNANKYYDSLLLIVQFFSALLLLWICSFIIHNTFNVVYRHLGRSIENNINSLIHKYINT